MKALIVGGSKHIGYFAAVRLLQKDWTVTFMLRSPSVFDNDNVVKPYIEAGTARLIKGDALIRDDVEHAWKEAAVGDDQPVDLLIFTVGSTTLKFSITKGFLIDPPNLVTACLFNVICTMPSPRTTKVVALSATGVVHASHAVLPLIYKPLYTYLLPAPHKDKLGVERIAAHCAGREWSAADPEPTAEIMGPGDWTHREGFPEKGTLKDIVVVRAAILTDGECHADKVSKNPKPYRVSDAELSGAYTVSRKDVAHFIVEDLLPCWDEYKGKCISVAY